MKLVVGSPGTWSGMALRVSQCVFSGASAIAMVTAFSFSNYTAFAYFLPLISFSTHTSLAELHC
jgi:hypothetical protein